MRIIRIFRAKWSRSASLKSPKSPQSEKTSTLHLPPIKSIKNKCFTIRSSQKPCIRQKKPGLTRVCQRVVWSLTGRRRIRLSSKTIVYRTFLWVIMPLQTSIVRKRRKKRHRKPVNLWGRNLSRGLSSRLHSRIAVGPLLKVNQLTVTTGLGSKWRMKRERWGRIW